MRQAAFTFYRYAAAALVDGDYGGLTDRKREGIAELDMALECDYGVGVSHVVSAEPEGYGLPDYGEEYGNLERYTLMW
jgi:hypothetical protein